MYAVVLFMLNPRFFILTDGHDSWASTQARGGFCGSELPDTKAQGRPVVQVILKGVALLHPTTAPPCTYRFLLFIFHNKYYGILESLKCCLCCFMNCLFEMHLLRKRYGGNFITLIADEIEVKADLCS